MGNRVVVLFLAVLVAGLLAAAFAPAAHAQDDQAVLAQAGALLRQIERRGDIDHAWNYVAQLEALIGDANRAIIRPILDRQVTAESEAVQLACAKVLGSLYGDTVAASAMAMQVLQASTTDAHLAAAADFVGQFADDEFEAGDLLADLITVRGEELSPLAEVAIMRVWYTLTFAEEAEARLLELAQHEDPVVQARAALAVAQDLDPMLDQAGAVVQEMRFIAGGTGSLARALSATAKMRQDIANLQRGQTPQEMTEIPNLPDYSGRSFPAALSLTVHRFAEVLPREILEDNGADTRTLTPEHLLEPARLLDAASQGIMRSLDNYSVYMHGKDMVEMNRVMTTVYGGIGGYVQQVGEYVLLGQPIYTYMVEDPPESGQFREVQGPAYAAGLRAGDIIVGGNGLDFRGWTTQQVIDELKGEPGTDVTVQVMRRGWTEPRSFEITRALINPSTTRHAMLPGGIGYLRLLRFGYNSANDVEASLQTLERQGMRALVLDLRDNGGGALTAVLDIARKFLPGRQLITYLQGRFGRWARRQNYHTEPTDSARDLPMVVLINQNSASGSEMLSGALQDHGRATIMGETSFGKGVGQAFLFLFSARGNGTELDPAYQGFTRWLRITTFAYFLPSGRSIEHTGVEPDMPVTGDILVDNPLYSCRYREWRGWQWAEIDRLFSVQDPSTPTALDRYILDHYTPENRERFARLAAFDDYDYTQYPGFEAWFRSLDTTLSRDDCRRLLRTGPPSGFDGGIRLQVADTRGRAFAQNFQEDAVLQAAIVHVAEEAGLDLARVREYRSFAGE